MNDQHAKPFLKTCVSRVVDWAAATTHWETKKWCFGGQGSPWRDYAAGYFQFVHLFLISSMRYLLAQGRPIVRRRRPSLVSAEQQQRWLTCKWKRLYGKILRIHTSSNYILTLSGYSRVLNKGPGPNKRPWYLIEGVSVLHKNAKKCQFSSNKK